MRWKGRVPVGSRSLGLRREGDKGGVTRCSAACSANSEMQSRALSMQGAGGEFEFPGRRIAGRLEVELRLVDVELRDMVAELLLQG